MYQVGLFPVSRRNTVAAYAGISRFALDFNISAVSSLVLSPLYSPCNSVSPLRGLAVRCDALRVSVCGARGTGPHVSGTPRSTAEIEMQRGPAPLLSSPPRSG